MDLQPISVPVRFACRLCKDTLFVDVAQFIEHKKEKHLTHFRNTKCIIFEDKEDDRILSDSFPNLDCVGQKQLHDLATQITDHESDLAEGVADTFPAAIPVSEVRETNISVPASASVPVISSSSQTQQRKVVYLIIRKKTKPPPVSDSDPIEPRAKTTRATNPLKIHAKLKQCITQIPSTLRSPSCSTTTLKAVANQQQRLASPKNNPLIVNPSRKRLLPHNLNTASEANIQLDTRILDFSDLLSPETILEEPEEAAILTNDVSTGPPTSTTPRIKTKIKRSGRKSIPAPAKSLSIKTKRPFKERKVGTRKLFKCPLCPREYFRTEKLLQNHEKKHDPLATDQPNEPKTFTCDTCGRSFGSNRNLKAHASVHSDLRPFKCSHPNCSKSFKTGKDLWGHKRTHSELRPFKCPYPNCDRTFKSKEGCGYHEQTQHAQERLRPFKCEQCNKSFYSSFDLNSHTKILHGLEGQRPEFKCHVCNKEFYHQSRLDRHSMIHSEDRPFKCMAEGCTAAFKSKSTLNTHVELLHSADKKFNQCEECGRCYSQLYTLKKHIKTAHKVE